MPPEKFYTVNINCAVDLTESPAAFQSWWSVILAHLIHEFRASQSIFSQKLIPNSIMNSNLEIKTSFVIQYSKSLEASIINRILLLETGEKSTVQTVGET